MAYLHSILGGLFLVAQLVSNAHAAEMYDAVLADDVVRIGEILRTNPGAINDDLEAGGSPLRLAALLGNLRVLEYLLANGGDINRTDRAGEAPLHAAAGNEGYPGNPRETVLFLLNHGANVNVRNSQNGMTPLHNAAIRGVPGVVSILLSHGASVNARDSLQDTPLLVMVERGHRAKKAIAELLVEKGADVNAVNTVGYTVLHKMALLNIGYSWPEIRAGVGSTFNDFRVSVADALETVDFLVSHGAKVNAAKDGLTPLHFAATTEKPELVELFIKRGSDINARSKSGETPLQFARSSRCPESVAVLRRYGAQ